ncbi:MAG: She9 / Mdm33 family protein [Clostridium sp.]|nr:She9 / Mdm33 family protein [Clostridium sp.]
MSYQWDYDNARSRYEDACVEINNCNRRICDLENQRRNKINQINQLNTDIKNTQTALGGVNGLVKGEEGLHRTVTSVFDATRESSENYRHMVEASSVINKDLCVVYGDEMSKTKTTVEDIMNTLKAKQAELTNKLNDLKMRLTVAKNELQNIENQLRAERANLQSLETDKRNAANDMEYYSRKIQEEEEEEEREREKLMSLNT